MLVTDAVIIISSCNILHGCASSGFHLVFTVLTYHGHFILSSRVFIQGKIYVHSSIVGCPLSFQEKLRSVCDSIQWTPTTEALFLCCDGCLCVSCPL